MAGRLFPAGGSRSIPLTKRVMILGRAADCDIRLDSPVVSNHHLKLSFDGNAWVVEDLKSRNGTVVNSRPVVKQALKSGDTLVVAGRLRFVIEYRTAVERVRFAGMDEDESTRPAGDDRSYSEHGPATTRLEPHDKDVWTEFE